MSLVGPGHSLGDKREPEPLFPEEDVKLLLLCAFQCRNPLVMGFSNPSAIA